MDLEKIKREAQKDAEKTYREIGLLDDNHEVINTLDYSKLPTIVEPHIKDTKLHWTRLSINSNTGVVIE